MATVTTKTYPTMDMTEFITDITNIYDWVQVDTTDTNAPKFYVDTDKYICVNKTATKLEVHNGVKSAQVSTLTSGVGYTIYTRFAKCKTGVILQVSVNNIYEYSPLIIIGTATNPVTNANEKVIFFDNSSSSSSRACAILSSDNKTNSIDMHTIATTMFNSKLTTAFKISTKNSLFVMDNALYIFASEMSGFTHGSVTFGGKNYYMMSAFMLED